MGMKPRLNDLRTNFSGLVTETKDPGEGTPLANDNLATKTQAAKTSTTKNLVTKVEKE